MPRLKRASYGCPLCWHCLKRLVYRRGGGGYTFALVRDKGGAQHRVHHDCAERALGDGVVRVPIMADA